MWPQVSSEIPPEGRGAGLPSSPEVSDYRDELLPVFLVLVIHGGGRGDGSRTEFLWIRNSCG